MMATAYPFKNLVFEGGGVKGLAYIGVLEILDTYNILPQIERVAGTSAGAITATLTSFKLNAKEIRDLSNTLDFSKIPQEKSSTDPDWIPGFLDKELDKILGDVDSVYRLVKRYGWYASDYFYNWLQETIASQCKGKGLATFADFQANGFCDLHIVVTDVSTHSSEVLSVDTAGDVPVADAVRMSMSIPLFFESLQFNGTRFGSGDYYADGGVLNNYPIHVFDHPQYAKGNSWFLEDTNWETLGCHLYNQWC